MAGRNEIKYFINVGDQATIRARIKHLMKPDPHAGPDGRYKIRSIYFDSPDNKHLAEKTAGVSMREKWRIRYYNDDLGFIRLERKSKRNKRCFKKSARLSLEQAQAILDGDIDWLAESDVPLFVEFHSKLQAQRLQPRVIVDYLREAYVYPAGNVRINFDTWVRTGLSSTDVFRADLPTHLAVDPRMVILEVKYDAFIPAHLSAALTSGSRLPQSISKYERCRIFESA
ncbi:MAG: polyphosphate polymerase domain-containing protein [Coriobacteriales bacterium]|nr:polyphosphate polymerase domain-containing protein [Coriobacteriales bacterium]MBQ6585930.1 polyphosphate polymerase domain-containing protein [Coriobacteriales bacterium]